MEVSFATVDLLMEVDFLDKGKISGLERINSIVSSKSLTNFLTSFSENRCSIYSIISASPFTAYSDQKTLQVFFICFSDRLKRMNAAFPDIV